MKTAKLIVKYHTPRGVEKHFSAVPLVGADGAQRTFGDFDFWAMPSRNILATLKALPEVSFYLTPTQFRLWTWGDVNFSTRPGG